MQNPSFTRLRISSTTARSWFSVAKFSRFSVAVEAFLKRHCPHGSVPEALIAVAGPVVGIGVCSPLGLIDTTELCAEFSFANVHILNDFEAVALSLPHLTSADLHPLGGSTALSGEPMLVLGFGSGLGVACLAPASPNPIVITSEGGHATMAATSAREDAIIDRLRGEFGHVSAERVLSGRDWKISTAQSSCLTESTPRRATPRSQRQH